MGQVEDATTIGAAPMVVYEMVTDITRMGEWSPECSGGRWLGDATGPSVGARFRGTNRKGPRRWSTVCTVTEAEAGRRFAFRVVGVGLPVAEWSYQFEATAGGCIVTERWTDRRPAAARTLTNLFLGVKDRHEHNLAGIRSTLSNLKSSAETARG
jgi:hypothetical protein